MTIERLNTNLTTTEKIRQLGEMIMELDGLIQKARFDKNELDSIFSSGHNDRKYLRDRSLGHTLATYGGWTHLKAETGYSIWKFTPTNYDYDSTNQLYLDNILLTNQGEALSETATAFNCVDLFDSDLSGDGGYLDRTAEASTEVGTEFELIEETTDYLYIGLSSKFSGIKFEFQTRGSGLDLVFEYYNGTSGDGWNPLTSDLHGLVDGTSDFLSDGLVQFNAPGDWLQKQIDNKTYYWIRISTTTNAVTIPKAYYVIPGNSVVGFLALSSDETIKGDWKWCSYNDSVYVTFRNAGASAHEGDYFITSSSSEVNKQNFFCFNHDITADHKDSTYSP